jgi:hypothetical protein
MPTRGALGDEQFEYRPVRDGLAHSLGTLHEKPLDFVAVAPLE